MTNPQPTIDPEWTPPPPGSWINDQAQAFAKELWPAISDKTTWIKGGTLQPYLLPDGTPVEIEIHVVDSPDRRYVVIGGYSPKWDWCVITFIAHMYLSRKP